MENLAAKAGYEEILKPTSKGLMTALKVLGLASIAHNYRSR